MSYSKEVMEHFRDPHNYGRIKNPDGIGKVGNIRCGDVMHLYIKIKNNKITDIRFETLGCAVAIAVSSVLTDLVKGKTVKDALQLDEKNILNKLKDVPPFKIHCSFLGVQALHEAIYDYFKKSKQEIPSSLEKEHKLNLKILKGHKHK